MHDLVLLDRHEAELRTLLDMGSGIEAAAYVVFGRSVIRRDPWIGNARIRLVSHRVIPISAEEQISASAVHVTWSTRGFVRELASTSSSASSIRIQAEGRCSHRRMTAMRRT